MIYKKFSTFLATVIILLEPTTTTQYLHLLFSIMQNDKMDVDEDNNVIYEFGDDITVVYGYCRRFLGMVHIFNILCQLIFKYYYLEIVFLQYHEKQTNFKLNRKYLLLIFNNLRRLSNDDNNFIEVNESTPDGRKEHYYVLKHQLEQYVPLKIQIHVHRDEETKKYESTLKINLKWSIRIENNQKYMTQKIYFNYSGEDMERIKYRYPGGFIMEKIIHLLIHIQINTQKGRFLNTHHGSTDEDGINAWWIMPELRTRLKNGDRTSDIGITLHEFEEKLRKQWHSDVNCFLGIEFDTLD